MCFISFFNLFILFILFSKLLPDCQNKLKKYLTKILLFYFFTYEISSTFWERNSSQNTHLFYLAYLFYLSCSLHLFYVFCLFEFKKKKKKIQLVLGKEFKSDYIHFVYSIYFIFQASAIIKKII